ncbi:hypothetical protein [Vreelandella titanicae]|uniref:hypothetical protein n=1 Tax=Vreelandella titanicae TaxID=664683 RepID=UPI001141C17F|nr:hypothetical protein [Halomonas titanicae]
MSEHNFSITPGFLLKSLVFTGPDIKHKALSFEPGCNLVYGASNTGKSLALKAIDFMLGGSTKLPKVDELKNFNKIWLSFETTGENGKGYTLVRNLSGGRFRLYEGVENFSYDNSYEELESQHDAIKNNNLSSFLLKIMNFDRKKVAKNKSGEKVSFTFRDWAHLSIVNERTIQDELSPIEANSGRDKIKDKRVFRSVLTGEDDSEVSEVLTDNKFKASKEGKVEIINEFVEDIDADLRERGFIDKETLQGELDELEKNIKGLSDIFNEAQKPINKLLKSKKYFLSLHFKKQRELESVDLNFERLTKLNEIYISDMQRLEALEEVGFLVSIKSNKECPLCGAYPEHMSDKCSFKDVELTREAAEKEIFKIKVLQTDLRKAMQDLEVDRLFLKSRVKRINYYLFVANQKIDYLKPNLLDIKKKLDHVNNELYKKKDLMNACLRRERLLSKRVEITKKRNSRKNMPELEDLDAQVELEFCRCFSDVLDAWGFPYKGDIVFNRDEFDIEIDGKLRSNNGKGVRAVTHAAFKVAILIFCRKKGLPHPGFIILDTPLLTYRDPLKSKYGDLSSDELKLSKTQLKFKFFEHMISLENLAQIIVLENIDPPVIDSDNFNFVEFSGDDSGERYGLLPIAQ